MSNTDKIMTLLEEFNSTEIDEAIGWMRDGRPVDQPSSYDTDVGPELAVGEDSRVDLEEMGHLERIIGPNNLLPVHFLTEGAQVQRAVAKVVVNPPNWSGSGYMVSRSLFMTNNHVIRNATDAGNARMRFNFQFDHNGNDQQVDEYRGDPASFFHTNAALDYTIVRLKAKSPFLVAAGSTVATEGSSEEQAAYTEELEPTLTALNPRRFPGTATIPRRFNPALFLIHAGTKWGSIPLQATGSYASGQRLNVIQHPSGRRKEVAVQANTITNVFTNHIRYTTDTEPGSSGSPVLNNTWDLVAIHHAAGSKNAAGQWVDNEGVRIDKIVDDVQSSLGGSTAGQAVLTELGI